MNKIKNEKMLGYTPISDILKHIIDISNNP